jgi:hypothetical protein
MTMRADYDSKADVVGITLVDVDRADYGDPLGDPLAGSVAITDGRAVAVEVLGPSVRLEEPLKIAAERYDLDREALLAAARAALAAPDRVVTLDIGARATS